MSNRGYYIHCGVVYILGGITTWGEESGQVNQSGSATIMTGLPSDLRPTSDVSTNVMVDWDNSDTPVGHILPTTVHPDGTWTFDGGNPYPGSDPLYYLSLSNASWPTADATVDTFTWDPLTPYLWTDWSGGEFAIHNTRLHLNGSLVAGASPAFAPLNPIPVAVAVSSSPTGDPWSEIFSADGMWRLLLNIGSVEMVASYQDGTSRHAHSGDVIDLTNCGWPIAYTPPTELLLGIV